MYSDPCHSWPHVTEEVSQLLGCDTFAITSWQLFGHMWPAVKFRSIKIETFKFLVKTLILHRYSWAWQSCDNFTMIYWRGYCEYCTYKISNQWLIQIIIGTLRQLLVGTNLNTRYSWAWQSDKNPNQLKKNHFNTNIGAGERGEPWWYISMHTAQH